jgi:hypothetical protein
MVLYSPGSKRVCPPAIPDDVVAVLRLLGLDYVWDAHHRCYALWRQDEGPDRPTKIWYHVSWHDSWVPTLTEISDDIASGKVFGVVSPGAIEALRQACSDTPPSLRGLPPWV